MSESLQKLRSVIAYSLEHDHLDTADFTCQLLLAETSVKDPSSVHLYAQTKFKQGQYKSCFNLTANVSSHPGCIYLFGRTCFKLAKYNEGISRLTDTLKVWQDQPDAASFHCMLGHLYQKSGATKHAAVEYGKALKLNPYLWECFEELCKMGVTVNTKALFKTNSTDQIQVSRTHHNVLLQTPEAKREYEVTTPNNRTRGVQRKLNNMSVPEFKIPSNTSSELAPPVTFASGSGTSSATRRSVRPVGKTSTPRLVAAPPMSFARETPKTPTLGSRKTEFSLKRGKALLSTMLAAQSPEFEHTRSSSLHSMDQDDLKQAYTVFAKAYKALCQYDCFKVVRVLKTAVPEKYHTMPWVMSSLGRAHFEIANYEEAAKYYQMLRNDDRTRTTDMEYYSTLLWHLNRKDDLCFLAHELLEVDSKSPVAWCAVGNLFSLSKEHDEAIKAFKKATDLDHEFAYAYTLQGHEHVANDAFDQAQKCFRLALAEDSRHYNAHYGLGMCFMKMGEYPKSLFHFRKAYGVNPVNVILVCCIGMVLERLEQFTDAAEQYELACNLQPTSALALFKKSQLLLQMGNYNSALVSFERLVEMAPDEASVHFLLGQLYKILGRKNDAIKQFTIALNLDPKGSQLIRDALESINSDEDM